jgi:8-amino-7-oxononanoate synthase
MDDDLTHLRLQGLFRVRRPLQSAQGARIQLRGRALINFASNDYLNLASDRRLARAAARAARRYGCGAGASPLVSGRLPPIRRLERALARFEGTESALAFSSGYAANLAAITSLVGRDDIVFSDALNHASLIDGCRLSRARIHVYLHSDVCNLEDQLRYHGTGARRRLLVSDSVFSMDGDLAPVAELLDLADRYDCMLLLDEAHATGVLGARGRGVIEWLTSALDSDRLLRVGTLSKAFGAQGGFICGSRRLIAYLVNRARPYVFSTALAPPIAAAAHSALRIAEMEPQRRSHLLALAEQLRERLTGLGLPASRSCCHIVPLLVGGAIAAAKLSKELQARGLLVPAIRPPSVPEGTARLRISLTAGHTEADVGCLADALGECRHVLQRGCHAHG